MMLQTLALINCNLVFLPDLSHNILKNFQAYLYISRKWQ